MELCIALDFIEDLLKDNSMPKNVRAVLTEIKVSLNCEATQIPIRIDAALQKVEELSMDANINSFSRSELWNLTSVLESLNQR